MKKAETNTEIAVVTPDKHEIKITNQSLTKLELHSLSDAEEFIDKNGKKQLKGFIRPNDLKQNKYNTWFEREYNNYHPIPQKIEQLKNKLNNNSIKIVMATWCGDTQRDVPRFLKILDAVGFPQSRLTIVAVDRTKKTPDGNKVLWVPTFIVSKNGSEQGRIGKRPPTGEKFETDLLEILS